MLLDPTAETMMRMFLSVTFRGIMSTCAESAWKLRFRVLMLGWISWKVWLKSTEPIGTVMMAVMIAAVTKMAIETIPATTNGSFLNDTAGLAGVGGARVIIGVPQL